MNAKLYHKNCKKQVHILTNMLLEKSHVTGFCLTLKKHTKKAEQHQPY